MLRTIGLTILVLGAASPAFAHTGHAASGFLHPLSGIDHLLAMVGAGLVSAAGALLIPRLLGPLAIVDVHQDRDRALKGAGPIEHRLAVDENPEIRPLPMPQSQLVASRGVLFPPRPLLPEHGGAVVVDIGQIGRAHV